MQKEKQQTKRLERTKTDLQAWPVGASLSTNTKVIDGPLLYIRVTKEGDNQYKFEIRKETDLNYLIQNKSLDQVASELCFYDVYIQNKYINKQEKNNEPL